MTSILLLAQISFAAVQSDDILVRVSFSNNTIVDATDIVRLALFGPSPNSFAPAYALERSGRFVFQVNPSNLRT